MREFKFRDNAIHFLIDGNEYSASAERAAEVMEAIGRVTERIGGSMAQEEMREIADVIVSALDGLFGAGAVREIFGSREISLLDLADLAGFIAEEVTTFGKQKVAQYGT